MTPELPHCLDCGRDFFYPRVRCPHCLGARVELRAPSAEFRTQTYAWVMRPQSDLWSDRLPVLLMMAEAGGVQVIAEGHGWTPDTPPAVGERVAFATADGVHGTPIEVFTPWNS